MKDFNCVNLLGRLTKDMEVSKKNDLAIGKFSIANNGNKNSVNFFNCVIFGKFAESIKDYMVKGKQIILGGELKYGAWEKNGVKRSEVIIIVNSIQFTSANKKEEVKVENSEDLPVEQIDDFFPVNFSEN